jgi:hypothetical protein
MDCTEYWSLPKTRIFRPFMMTFLSPYTITGLERNAIRLPTRFQIFFNQSFSFRKFILVLNYVIQGYRRLAIGLLLKIKPCKMKKYRSKVLLIADLYIYMRLRRRKFKLLHQSYRRRGSWRRRLRNLVSRLASLLNFQNEVRDRGHVHF